MALQTFGSTADGGSAVGYGGTGKIAGSIYTSPGSGTIQKLTARIWAFDGTGAKIKPVIYSVSGGSPDTLLAIGSEVTITNTAEAEVDFTISLAITATDYFIGVHGVHAAGAPTGFFLSRSTYGTSNRISVDDDYSDGTPTTFPTPAIQSTTFDIYATYDDGAGGGGATNGFKVYNGSTFEVKPVKVYNGSTWETKPLKRYNGSTWEDVEY